MNTEDIRRVLIVGAGTMGQQIAFQCALHGLDVSLHDSDPLALPTAEKKLTRLAAGFVSWGRIPREQTAEILARIHYEADAATAAQDCDLLSESVPEDPQIKAGVFALFNKLCPAHCIFTTNTSLLVPSMFSDDTGRPDRFAALHFHDIRTTNVVDIMPHPGTSPETMSALHGFCVRIAQTPIVLNRENPGYVFNTMLSHLFVAALTLAQRQVAAVEDIDRAWMGVMHAPMGPFGIMDQVGLGTVFSITDYWAQKTGDSQARANASFLKAHLDEGRLGYKNGHGFYRYPDPVYARPDFLVPPEADKED